MTVPTGNTSEVVQAYYQTLYARYYGKIALDRATHLRVSSLVTVFSWGIGLALFFFLLAYSLNHAHRRRGELYEAVSFAGSLLERNGAVSVFTWLNMLALFIVILYQGIQAMIIGFPY